MECETINWLNRHSGKYELSHSGMSGIVNLREYFKNYELVSENTLKDEIASLHGVKSNRIVITHGATEAFSMVLFHLREKYKSFHANYPEYEMIYKTPEIIGFNSGNDIFVGSNPNNPTGTMQKIPESKANIIDETFMEFTDSLDHYSYDNGFIVNTFTKLYGCGDLRLGYIVAPESADAIKLEGFKGLITEDVSPINISIGYKILKNHDALIKNVKHVMDKNHKILVGQKKKLKFYNNIEPLKIPVSFVDYSSYTDMASDKLSEALAEEGIIAVPAKFFGLRGPYLRVCTTQPDFEIAYSRLLDALECYLA
ncbi:MAG: pyridoxal phosphate-dependent aminotransferase [Ferroplasma sp.]